MKDIELDDLNTNDAAEELLPDPESDIGLQNLGTDLPPVPENQHLKGILLYIISVACNSLMAATSKLAVESAGPIESVLIRQLPTLAAICLYLHLTHVPHNIIGAPEHRLLLFIRGSVGLINILCLYFALQYVTLPDVAALGVLTPLVTVLLAGCFLGEKIVWQQGVCSIVSLLGVVIIARPPAIFGSEESSTSIHRSIAVLAALAGIIGTGTVTIILRKLKSSHSLQSVGWYALSSTIGSLVIISGKLVTNKPSRFPENWSTVLLILGSGIFGFLFQALQARALQLQEASKLVNFRYTSLIWAAIWEFIFWKDLPDVWTILGTTIVLSSVLYERWMVSKI